MKFNKLMIAMGMACGVMLTGCNDSEDSTPPTEPETQLQTFAPNGLLKANIRRTTYGVPHIQADNLESLGFGSGYAQAQDNLCALCTLAPMRR